VVPPVQSTLLAAAAVTAIVGQRVYQSIAPQDITQPYVVWSVVTSAPGNNLSETPEYDDQRVQIDCWSTNQSQARQLGQAVRDAIEVYTHIVYGPWNDYEPDTKLHRWSMDAEYFQDR
jgi:hypothetical protein